jgi:hypothetical protein
MKTEKFKRKLRKIKRQGEQYKVEKQLRDMYAEYWPEHKKRKTSNVMLAIIVTAITLYTVASFWIQYSTGVPVDSTLTTCFYTFWGSELVALTGIKISKVFKPSSDGEACG